MEAFLVSKEFSIKSHKGLYTLTFNNSGLNDLNSNPIDDAIYIDIPGPEVGATAFETVGTPNSPSSALGNAGAFLRSAPHTIMTEAPFQVNCDFVFRNLAVTVVDREPVYP